MEELDWEDSGQNPPRSEGSYWGVGMLLHHCVSLL